MAPVGHTVAHTPHEVHAAGSMRARAWSMRIAPKGQAFSHRRHPMHPREHTALTALPRRGLAQRTCTRLSSGRRSIRPLGHASTHFPHPMHRCPSTRGIPSGPTRIASKGHTRSQVPSPRQP